MFSESFWERPLPLYPTKRGVKKCAACMEDRPPSDFFKKPGNFDGLSRYCRVCSQQSGTRSSHKKRAEGDASYYENKAREQNYCCEICGVHQSKARGLRSGRLYFDHNHKTNERRGLLCHPCNVSLGWAEKRGSFTETQSTYIKKYEGVDIR